MFCPDCRSEYVKGITRCAECGAALVTTLPPLHPAEDANAKLVTVVETGDQAVMLTIRSLLESEGIACFVKGEMLRRFGHGYNAAIPFRLQVRADQEQMARELIENAAPIDDIPGKNESQ